MFLFLNLPLSTAPPPSLSLKHTLSLSLNSNNSPKTKMTINLIINPNSAHEYNINKHNLYLYDLSNFLHFTSLLKSSYCMREDDHCLTLLFLSLLVLLLWLLSGWRGISFCIIFGARTCLSVYPSSFFNDLMFQYFFVCGWFGLVWFGLLLFLIHQLYECLYIYFNSYLCVCCICTRMCVWLTQKKINSTHRHCIDHLVIYDWIR